MEYQSGIYQIENLINEKIYIGSAVNLIRREYEHFKDLKYNHHGNKYLQDSYNIHGKDNFIFEIIEYVKEKSKLIEREQHYLDIYFDNQKKCYNILPTAGSTLGRKMTKEQRIKNSERQKGENSPRFGIDMPKETVKKIQLARKKTLQKLKLKQGYCFISKSKIKFTKDQINKIVYMYNDGKPVKQIKKYFNCSSTPIYRTLKENNIELLNNGFIKCKNYWKGKHHTEETKKKISNSNKGKVFSKEHREKISLSKQNGNCSTAKLTVEDVITIKKMILEGCTNTYISKLFNVKQHTISQIKTGKTWSYITI